MPSLNLTNSIDDTAVLLPPLLTKIVNYVHANIACPDLRGHDSGKFVGAIAASITALLACESEPKSSLSSARHSCAVTAQSTVSCHGDNAQGQLGDGSFAPSKLPVPVMGLHGVKAVIAGSAHSCALKNDGTVWCWGEAHFGKLGMPMAAPQSKVPVQVESLSSVLAITAIDDTTFAALEDGSVWAWGRNAKALRERAAPSSAVTPVQVVPADRPLIPAF